MPLPPRPLPAMFNVYLCYSCRLCVNVLPVLLPPGWDYHSSQNLSFYMCTFSERIFSYLLVNIPKSAFSFIAFSRLALQSNGRAFSAAVSNPTPVKISGTPGVCSAAPVGEDYHFVHIEDHHHSGTFCFEFVFVVLCA